MKAIAKTWTQKINPNVNIINKLSELTMRKMFLKLLLSLFCFGLVFSCSQNSLNQTKPIESNNQQQWRRMSDEEKNQEIMSLINHKMGIAALNQLALEDFIGYDCKKSFYSNDYYGGMQTLLRIKCSNPKGASVAIGYDEVRVIFNRFEGNIEDFEIQRIGEESDQSTFSLPD